MRAFIRRVLELSGLEVGRCLEASNGAEALRLLEDNWVDAVLTDINMPEMDGEELLRRMAEAAGSRSVSVLLTGMGSDGARGLLKMKQAGARTIAQDETSCVVFGMPKEASVWTQIRLHH